jgi:hypothetical protein
MDSTLAENADLYRAIGFSWGGDGSRIFNLPDLRGYFLRGVDVREHADSRDPDGETRTAIHEGGATGNAVGTVQDYGTAMPNAPVNFEIEKAGAHVHRINFKIRASRDVDDQNNTVADPGLPGQLRPITEPDGEHQHKIKGGNSETRPINAAVNWLIRAR